MFHIRWVKQMAAYYDEKFYFFDFPLFFFATYFVGDTLHRKECQPLYKDFVCVDWIAQKRTNEIYFFAYIFQKKFPCFAIYGLTENYRNFQRVFGFGSIKLFSPDTALSDTHTMQPTERI